MRSAKRPRTAPGRAARRRPDAIERTQTIAVLREALDALVVMLSPFAPHTAEELWQMLGHADGLRKAGWPSFDPEVAKADEVVVPVQVNGKVRARVTVSADLSEDELRERGARPTRRCRRHTDGQDDPEGRRREGAAGQRGGVVKPQTRRCAGRSARCCVAVLALLLGCCRAAATRSRAAARSCRDYIKIDRRPDVREPDAALQPGDAADREGPGGVHRPRQVQIVPERRTSMPC